MSDSNESRRKRIEREAQEIKKDVAEIKKKTDEAIREILRQIARKIGVSLDELLEALRKIGEYFEHLF